MSGERPGSSAGTIRTARRPATRIPCLCRFGRSTQFPTRAADSRGGMRSAVRTTRAAGCPPAASIASAAIRLAAAVYLVAAALVLGSRTPAGASIVGCELGLAGLLVAMSVMQVRACEGSGQLARPGLGRRRRGGVCRGRAGLRRPCGAGCGAGHPGPRRAGDPERPAGGFGSVGAGGGWRLADRAGAAAGRRRGGVAGPSLGLRLGVAGGVAMVTGTLAVELSHRRRRLQELVDGLDAVVWEIDVATLAGGVRQRRHRAHDRLHRRGAAGAG